MRPLDKYTIGQSVTLDDGTTIIIDIDYNPYRKARHILLNNFGDFCSYCENSLHNGTLFDTEHIRPKGKNPTLETKWENFLIGCRACNGPSGKGEDDIVVSTMHLPHINNTYLSLVYDDTGGVSVNTNLNKTAKENAQALIDFLKLDKTPVSSEEDKDGRCKMRRQTWQKAKDALDLYNEYRDDKHLRALMSLIKAQGGWSIWFTVFKDYPEVRKALIDEFPGTAKNCFDPSNGYEPIDRNPGNSVDPT